MFNVTISEKGGQPSVLDFNKTEITIGRMKGNDIVLPKGNVSKQHTRIFMRDSGFYVLDLQSTNGTYVNGRKVTSEQPITEADKVYIGDFILQVGRAQSVPKAPPAPPRSTGGFPPAPPNPGLSNPGLSNPGPSNPGLSNPGGMNHPPKPPTTPPVADRQYAKTEGPLSEPLHPNHMAPPRANLDFEPLSFDVDPLDGADPERTPLPSAPPSRPIPSEPVRAMDQDFRATSAGPAGSRGGGAVGLGLAPAPEPRTPERAPAPQPSPMNAPGVSPAPAASLVSSGQAVELVNEFDVEFHAAQHDVARVLFETMSMVDFPLSYPPEASERSRFESTVRGAIARVNPRVDQDRLADALISECVGLGPVEGYLDDTAVADIYVNRYDRILLRRDGELVVAPKAFSHPDFLHLAAQRLLGGQDGAVGADEVRFSDGTRVHVVMPPVAVDGPALTVRKPRTAHRNLEELVADQVLSPGMAAFLAQAVQAGRSILVAGPTHSGKSTLTSALIDKIANGTRIISVEQNSHLNLPQASAVRLEANLTSAVDMRYLLRSATAMHPDRIVVDECRGAEAYDWVTSAACGTEGSMMTLHGTSASDALGRLESLCLLGSADLSPRGLREQIARAVNLVVIVHDTPSKGFRVQQITEVQGVDLDAFRLNDVFYFRVEGTVGGFHPTGYIPMFIEDLRHNGASVDLGIFRE